ncbi:hypothetical protein E5P48_24060, partial [Escherichia coli]
MILRFNRMNSHIKNTIILFADKLFTLSTGLLIAILAARIFGPAEFGLFNYVTSLIGVLGFIYTLGLENVVINEASNIDNKQKLELLFVNSTALKFLSSLIGIIILLFYCYFFSRESYELALILGFANFILFANSIDFIFQGTYKFNTLVILRLVSKTLMTLVQLCFLLILPNIYYFAAANIVYNSMYVILLWVTANISFSFFMISKEYMLELLKKSLPFTLASVAIPIFMQSDTIMLMHITNNAHETGLYSAVQRILLPASVVGSVLSVSIFSIIKNSVKLQDFSFLIKIHSVIFYGTALLGAIVTCYSEVIMTFLYGNKYLGSGQVLSYSIWIILFSIIGPIGTKMLICANASKVEFYKTAIAAIINIFLNLFFIKKWGAVGA